MRIWAGWLSRGISMGKFNDIIEALKKAIAVEDVELDDKTLVDGLYLSQPNLLSLEVAY
jgi:hypothetical protein